MTWRNTTGEHLGWAWKLERLLYRLHKDSPPSFTSASYQHLPPSFSSNLGTSSSTVFHTNSLHPLVPPDLSFSHLSPCDYVICWFSPQKEFQPSCLQNSLWYHAQVPVQHPARIPVAFHSSYSCPAFLHFPPIRALLPSWVYSAAQE